ncbi:MAG TPA: SDR family oxidoreductase [Solirubrobacteraceae bacterium]|jgi:citronellol/citronellal dehydrogenase
MSGHGEGSKVFAPGLLNGQVALVTGGGTGLGKATAIELARCGASVTIVGRRGEVLEQAAREVEAVALRSTTEDEQDQAGKEGQAGKGGQAGKAGRITVAWVVGDVREREEADRLVQSVLERHGRLDLLVNNAGGQFFAPAEGIAVKGWRAVWRLNVDGMLNMAEAAYALALAPAGGGTIVNVTLSPHHGMPGMAHSGAARATVEALTSALGRRWAADGISVSAVAAGHFETEALEKYPQALRAGMARSVPLQRLGTVAEHAWLVTLLASPLGRALNGSTVTLDGARDNWFGPWPPPGLAGEGGEVPTEERKGSPTSG